MISFTIITCVYNAESILQYTLDSVLEQKVRNLKHLIVDGASNDDTIKMASEYATMSERLSPDHKVEIYSKKDDGLYDAMNKGINLSGTDSDYIVFLNAGDRFPSPDTLLNIERTAEAKVKEGGALPGILYGDTDIIKLQGDFLRHRRLAPPKEGLSWRSFKNGMLVCHQAFYVLSDIAKQTPYNINFRFSADVDWCIRAMKLSESMGREIVRVPGVVANYLEGGMTAENRINSLIERFKVMKRHYGLLQTIFRHVLFIVRAIKKRNIS